MKEKDEQLKAPLSIILTFIFVIGFTMLMTSCSAYKEILPGLCYSDRDNTFTCPCPEEQRTYHGHCVEEIKPKKPKPELPETYKQGDLQCSKYGLIEYCEGRTQSKLNCTCVNHNDMSRTTDFLWRR